MSKKIYVSGPVSDIDTHLADKARYAKKVANDGKYAVNQLNSDEQGNVDLRQNIKLLLDCEEAHFLPEWEKCRVAKIEHQIAKDLGMKITYVPQHDCQIAFAIGDSMGKNVISSEKLVGIDAAIDYLKGLKW
jgi:hypothetical protein